MGTNLAGMEAPTRNSLKPGMATIANFTAWNQPAPATSNANAASGESLLMTAYALSMVYAYR